MKKLMLITLIVLGAVLSVFGQYGEHRGNNQEPFIGYTASYGVVRTTPTQLSVIPLPDEKALTHGITLGYAFYFKKDKSVKSNVFGIATDVNVQWRGDDIPVTATVAAGLVYKARFNKKVQPFVRVMAGGARIGFKQIFVNGVGLRSTASFGSAIIAGAGFDIAKENSRLKWRIGADYVRASFDNGTHTYVRGTTGLVF